MKYWLLKSEPNVFSLEHLRSAGRTSWDGVRNYQARNNLRAMKVGDLAFFYHSRVEPPGIVGICRVVREAYPDPSQFDPVSKYYDPGSKPEDPRWSMVDVEFVEELPRMVCLPELKAARGLAKMVVVQKGSRLSVQPVTAAEWKAVLKLAGGRG